MKAIRDHELPAELEPLMRRATLLAWATIAYMSSVIVIMYFTLGNSQAMKTAWAEDILSLVGPIAFLVASPFRDRSANDRFPFGYHRAATVAFAAAALALIAMGLFLVYEALAALLAAEHPTIGSVSWTGEPTWLGWWMIAALLYSVVGPVILGHLKRKPAEALHEKTLYADAQMNKADWLTGLAGVLGVLGIALGLWWADSAAALAIACDITRDGTRNLKAVLGDIMDRRPAKVDHSGPDPLPERLRDAIARLPWVADADVRLRETGHVVMGQAYVVPRDAADPIARCRQVQDLAHGLDWRVQELTVQLVDTLEDEDAGPA